MSLEDIKQILDKLSYKQIIVAHYNHLQSQLDQLEQNIANTTSLINLIELDNTISWEKVTDLIHHSNSSSKSWIDYFKEEELSLLETYLPSLSNNDEMTAKYIVMLKKIETFLSIKSKSG